ncbi:hypothetical protein BV898_08415 [Hypsibius exemplaris]|uniref:Uncharacterized protein n=1 Tax=Hypsibius exemplaris TaxID=2072580 RepID=A0A1W0WQK1_HYPEX|nr:hypothetical protein BV898_08415 [Hypsibius exemplaris]
MHTTPPSRHDDDDDDDDEDGPPRHDTPRQESCCVNFWTDPPSSSIDRGENYYYIGVATHCLLNEIGTTWTTIGAKRPRNPDFAIKITPFSAHTTHHFEF